jgi:hypothetical protein
LLVSIVFPLVPPPLELELELELELATNSASASARVRGPCPTPTPPPRYLKIAWRGKGGASEDAAALACASFPIKLYALCNSNSSS